MLITHYPLIKKCSMLAYCCGELDFAEFH